MSNITATVIYPAWTSEERTGVINGVPVTVITDHERGTAKVSEAPYTCYPVTVSVECAPGGNGQCDGNAEDGTDCECVCHRTDLAALGMSTVAEVESWHREFWTSGEGLDF